jgi:hypothetical protein
LFYCVGLIIVIVVLSGIIIIIIMVDVVVYEEMEEYFYLYWLDGWCYECIDVEGDGVGGDGLHVVLKGVKTSPNLPQEFASVYASSTCSMLPIFSIHLLLALARVWLPISAGADLAYRWDFGDAFLFFILMGGWSWKNNDSR